jgi:threonine/homoserine/homoserine lactone efflux protein
VDEALAGQTVGMAAAKRSPAGPIVLGIFVGVVNLVALVLAISFPATYVTQGTPAELGNDYIPLWAVLFMAILCGSVPVVTVVFLVRWLRSRARERRALASDTPLPPGTLD